MCTPVTSLLRYLLMSMLVAWLAACGQHRPAPVEDRTRTAGKPAVTRPAPVRSSGFHTVRRGETLYAIAFGRGLDYKAVAAWNEIPPPYLIYPGQRLRLTGPPRSRRSASVSSRKRPSSRPAAPPATPPQTSRPASSKPSATPPPAASKPTVTRPSAGTTRPATSAPAATPQTTRSSGGIRWQWPTSGPVASTFLASDPGRKGIDITGRAGQPVRAAAAGEVVYSGTGLIGYGGLIIVKHSDSILSAYGHNRRRLVNEGDRVSAGQVIGEMGSNDQNRTLLHFEIRLNGRPVDPVRYLPAR